MSDQTINEVQDEIIDEFSLLEGDMESTIYYMMEIGDSLPPLAQEAYVNENLVQGCQSKVWLTSQFEDGKVHFSADSNTKITKGLISLLIRIWQERKPEEIVNTDLYFINKIGMDRVIGSKRSNGFASMIKDMKTAALIYQKSQVEQH